MKNFIESLIFLLIIGGFIMGIVFLFRDASAYVTFQEAKAMAEKGKKKRIHILGKLKRDEARGIVGIKMYGEKVSFSFIMVDEDEEEEEVFYNAPIPPDFTHAEKLVVAGSYKKGRFVAKKIFLKCPSKYQEEQIKVSKQEVNTEEASTEEINAEVTQEEVNAKETQEVGTN
ncbi:MAG: cytochrome c maturation protein CcmE [Cytophagales bacterium]|nr:cytochrome c maturation protein CcmE [Cytophagales bacterium]